MSELLDSLFAFAVLFAVFLPLERLLPAHRQKVIRKEWGTDLLFFLGQYLLWTTPVVMALVFVHQYVDSLPLGDLRAVVAAQPFWLQVLGVIVLCDVSIYWAHRYSQA